MHRNGGVQGSWESIIYSNQHGINHMHTPDQAEGFDKPAKDSAEGDATPGDTPSRLAAAPDRLHTFYPSSTRQDNCADDDLTPSPAECGDEEICIATDVISDSHRGGRSCTARAIQRRDGRKVIGIVIRSTTVSLKEQEGRRDSMILECGVIVKIKKKKKDSNA